MKFIESSANQPFFCYLPTPAVHFPVQAEPNTLARIKARGVTEEQTNLSRLSMIENLDDNLGRLLSRLEELGLTPTKPWLELIDGIESFADYAKRV